MVLAAKQVFQCRKLLGKHSQRSDVRYWWLTSLNTAPWKSRLDSSALEENVWTLWCKIKWKGVLTLIQFYITNLQGSFSMRILIFSKKKKKNSRYLWNHLSWRQVSTEAVTVEARFYPWATERKQYGSVHWITTPLALCSEFNIFFPNPGQQALSEGKD